jgi:hypothetical protein
MSVQPEVFGGIEFVRIAHLPFEERELLFRTFQRDYIIKILRNNELLNDCIQLVHYKTWRTSVFLPSTTESPSLKLAS